MSDNEEASTYPENSTEMKPPYNSSVAESKAERRRLAKQRRKERIRLERENKSKRKKMTKEERRAKYTQRARERRDRVVAKHRHRDVICYRCRKRGHAASDCITSVSGKAGDKAVMDGNICYRCGSIEHGLARCPQIKTTRGRKLDYTQLDLPYAECFICGETGHLASCCERNNGHGIYVNGGSCRSCGSVGHLSSDCPKKTEKNSKPSSYNTDEDADGIVVDDLLDRRGGGDDLLHDNPKSASAPGKSKKRKIVKF